QGEAFAIGLSGKQISDQTFDNLLQIGNISGLNLSKSNFSDAHAERLNQVGGCLMNLDLSHTGITDAGVEKLHLPFLTNLTLTGTQVTPGGIDRFKKNRQNGTNITKNPKITM